MTRNAQEALSKRRFLIEKFFTVVDAKQADPNVAETLRRPDVLRFNTIVLTTIYGAIQKNLTPRQKNQRLEAAMELCERNPATTAMFYLPPYVAAALDTDDHLVIGGNDKAFRVIFSPEEVQTISYQRDGKAKSITLPLGVLCVRFSRNNRIGELLTSDKYQFPVNLAGAEVLAGGLFPRDLRGTTVRATIEDALCFAGASPVNEPEAGRVQSAIRTYGQKPVQTRIPGFDRII